MSVQIATGAYRMNHSRIPAAPPAAPAGQVPATGAVPRSARHLPHLDEARIARLYDNDEWLEAIEARRARDRFQLFDTQPVRGSWVLLGLSVWAVIIGLAVFA
jgi:hypothetical protein